MERVEVLGVDVHAVTSDELIELMAEAIADGRRLVVGNHNLHSVYLWREQPAIRRFFDRADVVFADGMPLVIASRIKGAALQRRHRATPLDWIDALLDAAVAGGWRVHLLGSAPTVIERAVRAIGERHPGVQLTHHHGYFELGGDDERAVLDELAAVRPDLLLVGMGMPRQELWVAEHADELPATVVTTVGGLFDYFAGETYTPPRWMGRVGLEWLGRLLADPRRLAKRYLVEPVLLAGHLVRERRS